MKFKKKITLPLLFLASSILTIPIALTTVSCSKGNTYSNSDLAVQNIKNNILNKSKAAWTLPSEINDDNLIEYLNLNDFSRTLNKGFELANPTLVKDQNGNVISNDDLGTLKIKIELFKGNQKVENEFELEGFLTNSKNEINTKLFPIQDLNIKENDGSFLTNARKNGDSNYDFNDVSNKTIRELLNENDSIHKQILSIDNLDDYEIIGLDTKTDIITIDGVIIPLISKNLSIKEISSGLESSPFTLVIQGYNKDLTEQDVTNIIKSGSITNGKLAKYIFASELNDRIASNTSDDKTTLFNKDLSNRSKLSLFNNYNDVSIKYKENSLKNANDENGVVDATFIVSIGNNEPFLVDTTLYGFVAGHNNKTSLFSKITPYISDNNLNIAIYGRNLKSDLNQYMIEYYDENAKKWIPSNNWKLSTIADDNISVQSPSFNNEDNYIKLTFVKDKNNDEMNKKVRISLVKNKTMSVVNSYQYRSSLHLKNEVIDSKVFSLDSLTASLSKDSITAGWILKNKDILFVDNSTILINKASDIKVNSVSLTNENSILKNIKKELIVNFTIKQGSSYDSNGTLTKEPINFEFIINNFADYTYLSSYNNGIDASTLNIDSNNKLNTKTKGEIADVITSDWVFENKNKLFNGHELITDKHDFSIKTNESKNNNSNNTKGTIFIEVKPGKYYDIDGNKPDVSKTIAINFVNLKEYAPLNSVIKDLTATEMSLDSTKTSEEAKKQFESSAIETIFSKKDQILGKLEAQEITSKDDIENHYITIEDTNNISSTKLKVTFDIKPGKMYDENGVLTKEKTTASFLISSFKEKVQLIDFISTKFDAQSLSLENTKTAGQIKASNIIDKNWIFNNKDKIWNSRVTRLWTSAENAIESVTTEVNTTTNTKLDVTVNVKANMSYNENGEVSNSSQSTNFSIESFKSFSAFSPIKTDFNVSELGLDGNKTFGENKIDSKLIFSKKDSIWKSDSTNNLLESDITIEKDNTVTSSNNTEGTWKITIPVNKVYEQDGTLNSSQKEIRIKITNFKDFQELSTASKTLSATDLGFRTTQTAKIAMNASDFNTKILGNINKIIPANQQVTGFIATRDVEIKSKSLANSDSTKRTLDVILNVKKHYTADGTISTTSKEISLVINNFKEFKTTEIKKSEFTPNELGFNSNDKVNQIISAVKPEWIRNKSEILFNGWENIKDDVGSVKSVNYIEKGTEVTFVITIDKNSTYESDGGRPSQDVPIEFKITNIPL